MEDNTFDEMIGIIIILLTLGFTFPILGIIFLSLIITVASYSYFTDSDKETEPEKPKASPKIILVNTPGYNYNLKKKQQYLASPAWDIKRKACLARSDYTCDMCDCNKPLEVHHLNYNTLFNERDEDICSLCRECHKKIHDLYGYKGNYFPLIKESKTTNFFKSLEKYKG